MKNKRYIISVHYKRSLHLRRKDIIIQDKDYEYNSSYDYYNLEKEEYPTNIYPNMEDILYDVFPSIKIYPYDEKLLSSLETSSIDTNYYLCSKPHNYIIEDREKNRFRVNTYFEDFLKNPDRNFRNFFDVVEELKE